MNENNINIINENNKQILFEKIKHLINKIFIKLNQNHKIILGVNLFKLIMIFSVYFDDENLIKQLYLNNYQDIFSLLILLLPYYNISLSKNIISLNELFLNENNKSKSLESSYYIDHINFTDNSNYLEEYFDTALKSINQTLSQASTKILPNWLNIFPYDMLDFKKSKIYKNFLDKFINFKFISDDNLVFWDTENKNTFNFKNISFINDFFILGYNNLYGTINNFLYNDIVSIKWMIFDTEVDNFIVPNILVICKYFNILDIYHKPWDTLENQNDVEAFLINKLNDAINNIILVKSLILFYLRWEKDNDLLNDIKIPKECKFIIKNLDYFGDDINDEDENFIYDDNKINDCIIKIIPFLNAKRIYTYIYDCVNKFSYTWYGYYCLTDDKYILSYDNYFNKYLSPNKIFDNNNKKLFYITPKNFYNYFKALIHITKDNNYISLGISQSWYSLNKVSKNTFIERINSININNWFNIKKNLTRTFKDKNIVIKIYNLIIQKIIKSNLIPDIIFETLVINNMLSYFKFNPVLTNNTLIPNKNKNYSSWKKYITSNLNISEYSNSFHWISNTKISVYGDNMINSIINSLWMTNFGGDWICQIQMFHHILNQRILLITGATGAGKSTVAPFMILYGVKIFNFKNNAKVVCTQPRIQPVKDNSERISSSIGMPYVYNEINGKKDIVKQNVNYIQFKYADGGIFDDLYHPSLTFYTDGLLYQTVLNKYLFKKTLENNIITSKNIFDVILIDEAHEHNSYMDLILTVSKFGTYVNNEVTLGIISATMDTDELIYRKYFEPIDDNWKAPLNISYITNPNNQYNSQYIDRRIHLSVPFGGTNYDIYEFVEDAKSLEPNILNKKVLNIVNKIISNSSSGDILIFEPGRSDIEKMVEIINKTTPKNVLAIPFYKDIREDILENIVKKIADKNIRKIIRYPKNKYTINDVYDIKDDYLLENTYNRFIIVATNIAEASITIDTLEYVIDTGNQKINVYDYNTGTENIVTELISVPNQKQRRGRVGRVKSGTVYYVYDKSKLYEKVFYKIAIENMTDQIISLATQNIEYTISKDNDPYIVDNIDKVQEFLKNQYSYYNDNYVKTINSYDTFKDKLCKKNVSQIIYPYSDGKYDINSLIDDNGIFFITHPNENDFIRGINILTIGNKTGYYDNNNNFVEFKTNIIDKRLDIIKKNDTYKNKIEIIINNLKKEGIIDENNLLSPYGNLLSNLYSLMLEYITNTKFIKMILDCFAFSISINSSIFKNILLFIIQNGFITKNIDLKPSKGLYGKSDYLIKSSVIPDNLFNNYNFETLTTLISPDLNNLNDLLYKDVNTILLTKFNIKDNIQTNTLIPDIIKNNLNQIKINLKSFYTIKYIIYLVLMQNYILKKSFKEIIDVFSNNNNFMELFKLYHNSPKYINKNEIQIILDKMLKQNNDKNTIKNINKIKNKIDKIKIIKNDNLSRINLNNNIKYSNELINQINSLSDYEKTMFIIAKNLSNNILIKIFGTEFYLNYYNKNVNNVFKLDSYNRIINSKTKTITNTKVLPIYRNYFVLTNKINDEYKIVELSLLTEKIILLLNNYFKQKNKDIFTKDIKITTKKNQDKYGIYYENILKNMNKIISFINTFNQK